MQVNAGFEKRRAQKSDDSLAVGLIRATYLLPIAAWIWLISGRPGERATLAGILLFVIIAHAVLVRADRRCLAAEGRPEFADMLRRTTLVPAVHIARRARAAGEPNPGAMAWIWVLGAALGAVTFTTIVVDGHDPAFSGTSANNVEAAGSSPRRGAPASSEGPASCRSAAEAPAADTAATGAGGNDGLHGPDARSGLKR